MSAIAVIAVKRVQGWAYVTTGGSTFFVEPPYVRDNVRISSLEVAQRAIEFGEYDPASPNDVFESWPKLFDWLGSEFVKERRSRSLPLPSAVDTERFIRESSPDDVRQFLRIIRRQFLAGGRYEAASRLISSLRAAAVVVADATLASEVTNVASSIERRLSHRATSLAPLAANGFRSNDEERSEGGGVRRSLERAPEPCTPLI